ncbi:MAG: serine protease [Bdellovibrionota bacterium]|nr:serine protease [Bdellovibrionota bacterium]
MDRKKGLAFAIFIIGICSAANLAWMKDFSSIKEKDFGADVIYGDDDRLEYFEVNDELQRIADSTLTLVRSVNLSKNGEEFFFEVDNFKEAMGLCDSEAFGDQNLLGFCSGSLVGPDLVLTAGHCITGKYDCEATSFVFDYNLKQEGDVPLSTHQDNVYGCAEVIHTEQQRNGSDFAVIRLDREVKGRRSLAIKRQQKAQPGDAMIVLGYPVGLPLKIAGGANVRSDKGPYFVANLDTYGGNSGSAVIDAFTGEVAGVLVRGETDFVRQGNCTVSNVCDNDACSGEDVTHASMASDFIP